MVMKIPESSFRRQFRQSVIATESEIQNRFEIDAAEWLKIADGHFKNVNPTTALMLEAEAVAMSKKAVLDEYIRSGRSAAVDAIRDLDKIARRARTRTRYEVIQVEQGQIIKKREIDCTIRERIILAEQYERSAASDTRRARYHRYVAAQLVLEGMGEGDSLQDWIDRRTGTQG